MLSRSASKLFSPWKRLYHGHGGLGEPALLGCAAGAKQIVEKCVDCLACLRTCPYHVPVIDQEGGR